MYTGHSLYNKWWVTSASVLAAWINLIYTCKLISIARNMIYFSSSFDTGWGVHSKNAGQQVERSILHQGQDSYKNSSHKPRFSPGQYNLTVQNCGLKQYSFHFIYLTAIVPTFSDGFNVCQDSITVSRHDNGVRWWCRVTWWEQQHDSQSTVLDVKCM